MDPLRRSPGRGARRHRRRIPADARSHQASRAPPLFLNGKSFLTPMRLVQFLALAALFSATFVYIARLPWLPEFLSSLGRNSLNVFCVGSLLSLSGQIIRFLYPRSLAIDTIVVVVGIGLLWLTAWMSEWRERQ
jgi:hypothetical protein